MSLQTQLLDEQSKLATLADEMDAISQAASNEGRELTADELSLLEQYPARIENSKKRIESLKASVAALAQASQRRDLLTVSSEQQAAVTPAANLPRISTYAPKSKYFKNSLDAYQCGMWMNARISGNTKAIQYCRDHGVGSFSNDMAGGTDTLGGYTVPDPLQATIIELFEQFSSYRTYARQVPMTSDTLRVPKLPEFPRTDRHPDSSLTVYYPDEGQTIQSSDLTFEQISMAAGKRAQLAKWSTELDEDSVISMTDLLARDIARNYAWDHDRTGFLGDGTAPFRSITGIFNALQAGATVTLAAGKTTVADIELADLNRMHAILSEYPGISPVYFMSKDIYYTHVVGLLQAAGGTDMRQIEEGGMATLNGRPVVFTQVLPDMGAAAGSDVIVCGDLDLGAYSAIRREVRIRVLTELFSVEDQLGIVSTMRDDQVVHSVGDANGCGCISKLTLAAT